MGLAGDILKSAECDTEVVIKVTNMIYRGGSCMNVAFDGTEADLARALVAILKGLFDGGHGDVVAYVLSAIMSEQEERE